MTTTTRWSAPPVAPQDIPHAQCQFISRDILLQKIINADLQAGQPGCFILPRRQHDDRIMSSRLDLTQDHDAVFIGQAEIKNDQIRFFLIEELK